MFKNLFKIALRNILKEKTYSAINILGLTIGITCSMFLLMYIKDELSFDRYHANAENVYRVVSNIKETDNAFTWAIAQIPLAEELRDNYPEVTNAVRFFSIGRQLIKHDDKQFYESDFYLADSTVFDMFSYRFIHGDPATALDQPATMVVTESIARKYFGSIDVVGESLTNASSGETCKITGVMEDVPLNSHFRFDALISRSSIPGYRGDWGNFGVYTYIQLPAGYDLAKMYASFDKINKEKINPIFEKYGITIKYELQKIIDIHLHSKIQDEAEAGGDISYIYIFGVVAVFMILIACINYMNLATARSANRAKEVGIRKVMGSQRQQLVLQFITESVVITLMALVVSLVIIYVFLPQFNVLANKSLPFSYITQPDIMLGLLAVVVFSGIVGGSYPAFYLSGFNPVSVLKGKLSARGGSVLLRKSLVVLQFAISIFMLISTLIVFDQLTYLRDKDLGFTKEQVVRFDLSAPELNRHAAVIQEQMRNNPAVVSAGMANTSPGEGVNKVIFKVEDNEGKMVERGVDFYSADYDFVTTMGMHILEGRDFSRDFPADTVAGTLVNEAMVRRMGWTNPLGKKFILNIGTGEQTRLVVGVLKDYNQNSLYEQIEPLMVLLTLHNRYLFVKTKPGDVHETLASLEKTWREVNPNHPFEYRFLDEDYNSQYRADEKRSQIFTAFSGLTIMIACLGLLGLAAFTTQQRYKEIGVRKVIGASVQGLIVLVAREFFLLVGIGMVLAFPLAWYFTDSWLQNFAYRIDLGGEWLTFVVSALLAFVITLATVGYHVIRAASANPVKALREE